MINVLQVGPIDAGTDNGFTFTAPNWPSTPLEKIFRITSQQPNHPANSFYYPELNDLPPIATFFFVKVKKKKKNFKLFFFLIWKNLVFLIKFFLISFLFKILKKIVFLI